MSYVTDRFSGMDRISSAPVFGQESPDTMRTGRPMPSQKQGLPLAMAWFGDQVFNEKYNPEEALMRGTLFPELDKPWLAGKGGMKHGAR